jgi:hypothetical protein
LLWIYLALGLSQIAVRVYSSRDETLFAKALERKAEAESAGRLSVISACVARYKAAHGGQLPPSIDAISGQEGWAGDSRLAKPYGDYRLPPNPNHAVLVYERPDRWPDGHVQVCFSDLTVKRLSRSEFEALASRSGFPVKKSKSGSTHWWWCGRHHHHHSRW